MPDRRRRQWQWALALVREWAIAINWSCVKTRMCTRDVMWCMTAVKLPLHGHCHTGNCPGFFLLSSKAGRRPTSLALLCACGSKGPR